MPLDLPPTFYRLHRSSGRDLVKPLLGLSRLLTQTLDCMPYLFGRQNLLFLWVWTCIYHGQLEQPKFLCNILNCILGLLLTTNIFFKCLSAQHYDGLVTTIYAALKDRPACAPVLPYFLPLILKFAPCQRQQQLLCCIVIYNYTTACLHYEEQPSSEPAERPLDRQRVFLELMPGLTKHSYAGLGLCSKMNACGLLCLSWTHSIWTFHYIQTGTLQTDGQHTARGVLFSGTLIYRRLWTPLYIPTTSTCHAYILPCLGSRLLHFTFPWTGAVSLSELLLSAAPAHRTL